MHDDASSAARLGQTARVLIDDLERAKRLVAGAHCVTVFTGAGISTDSGIPDFRGPNGVWTKNPAAEKASTLQHYLADPEVRRAAWQNRLNSPAWDAQPNRGHLAIYELERNGRLRAVVTQNIDGLHQRAGHEPANVIEVHGTMHWARCWGCDDRRPMQGVLDRVRAGEPDPPCELCGGILKSDTVSFGQSLVPEVIDAAFRAAEECDLLLAAGTSLSVFPAANVVPQARASGAAVVIVNGQPTAMDRVADAVLIGSLGELLPQLIEGI
ncbi:MAG TPA: Sir2 family NAD-dependent protein deacetylase [Ilumatobacteraceae bacterium]|nr:Sir2 family NAD-dependent protein deacetylase [Ilumatobacteraceae bacterium]